MKRILVADDEADITQTLRAVLEAEGYEVDTAANGCHCLERLRRQRPDLLLLDIMMPGLDGFEVLQRMRAESWQVPVILMSAIRPDSRMQDERIAAFLRKPFQLEVLLEAVDRALPA